MEINYFEYIYIMGPWLLDSEDDTGDQTPENEEAAEWEVGGLGVIDYTELISRRTISDSCSDDDG